MKPFEALAEGRLSEAIEAQTALVASAPHDLADRRLLIDLLMFAGRLDDARFHLGLMRSDAPEWPETERNLRRLFRSERLRTVDRRPPQIRPEPPPKHATRRVLALKALRNARPQDAVRCVDAAEKVTPQIRGFIDGREFEGLRDADDRYASILEVFLGGEYFWFTWESLRKVTLVPAAVLLDQLYRPAMLTPKVGPPLVAHLPMVYPGSGCEDGEFALGLNTDYVCPDGGPSRCVGAKLLLVGDEEEIPLSECRMIEVR
jgi:type VI secretion system protein ImpE